ncbi:MAG TPA: RodZ domain-containing protein [Gaiellaceae bacterium]
MSKAVRTEATHKPAQRRALEALRAGDPTELTRARYQQLGGVSRSQAAYDLAALVDSGALVRVGAGRSTRYRLAGQPDGTRRRWTTERIRAELSAFCAGRRTWPSAAEFKRAGRSDLYVAASRYGGIGFWADELSLERSGGSREHARRRPTWNARPIFAALALAIVGAGTAIVVLHALVGPDSRARPSATRGTPERAVSLADDLRSLRTAAVAARLAQVEGATVSRQTLVLSARRGDSWISARSPSGRLLYERNLARGQQVRLHGSSLWIRLGTASAVDASVDGTRARPLPDRAAVVVVTKRGIRVVEWRTEPPAAQLVTSPPAQRPSVPAVPRAAPPAPSKSSWPTPLPAPAP